MAVPSYTEKPKKPTLTSPSIPSHKCGEFWGPFTIRSPYKSTDAFEEKMPNVPIDLFGRYHKIGSKPGWTEFDEGANAYEDFVKKNAVADAIRHAESALSRHKVDAANRNVIQRYIDRAKKYAAQAKAVGDALWPSGMTSDRKPTWEGYSYEWGSLACLALRDLGIAAISNARCASEAAIAVGIHNMNKAKSGKGILYAPKKSTPVLTAPEPEPEPEPEPAPAPVPEPEKPAKTSAPKKKDNTMLLIGAAAIGLLLMTKK